MQWPFQSCPLLIKDSSQQLLASYVHTCTKILTFTAFSLSPLISTVKVTLMDTVLLLYTITVTFGGYIFFLCISFMSCNLNFLPQKSTSEHVIWTIRVSKWRT